MATASEIEEAGQRIRDKAPSLGVVLDDKGVQARKLAAAALTPGDYAQSEDDVTDAAVRLRSAAAGFGCVLDFAQAKHLAGVV